MTLAESIQVISTALVFVALAVSGVQLREVARQTRALRHSLQQSAYGASIGNQMESRTLLMAADEDLLSWFLSSRGYKSSRPQENKRRLYLLGKLESHAASFQQHQMRLLDEETWTAWRTVIEVDSQSPHFDEIWAVARRFYPTSFVQFIDSNG
jgi:hypothetical protein